MESKEIHSNDFHPVYLIVTVRQIIQIRIHIYSSVQNQLERKPSSNLNCKIGI